MTQHLPASGAPNTASQQQADSHPLVQQMYRQIQERVASNTRFQPDALQLTTASVNRQAIGINAVYTLTAGVNTRHITGRFQPAAQDQAHPAPGQAVQAALPALLQQAAHAAQDLLRQPQARYTAVNGKTRLGKSVRYWSMGTCSTCHGRKSMTCVHCNNGKTECTTCDTLGKQRCPQCDGACTVGCMQCGGSGTLTTTEPVSVNYTVYVNGQSQTEYRTEYHTVQRTCPSCSFGRSSCPTCAQSGRVRCRSCGGDHYLSCRYCDGNGIVSCQSCQGSGQTGTLAESMVTVDCQCKIDIPANSDPLLPAIQQARPLDTQLEQLDAQSLQALDGAIQGNSARLDARFTGQLEIVRLGVHCAGQDFSLAAFGKQTEWLEQDQLIERLLTADLAMLEKALLDADRQPLFKPDLLPVQQALGNALQARLHEQLALDSADAASGADAVSAAFAQRIQARSQTAARWLAKAMARRLWPWAAGSSLLLGGAAAAGGMAAALLASALAAGSWVLAYRLLTLRLFKSVYPSTGAAHSAWQQLWKQKQLLGPISALTAPAVLLAVAAVIWLPGMTLPGITAAPDAASATAGANGLEQAVQAWKQGDLSKARSLAGNLARQGDSSAFGFYAWLIAAGVGAEAGDPTAHDYAAAQNWIDRAYAANPGDLWAKTANATLLLEGLGTPRDSKKGTALLHSAAEGGLVPAMYMAGQYALRGKHVSQQNIMLARKWFGQAAAQHDADALYTLGNLDWHGVGLNKPDHSKAMQAWQESAALGNKEAAQAVKNGRPAQ